MFTRDLPPLMYNSSLYIKFFWVDDYYISGILATSVNATYMKFNKIYIINNNLVEKTFMNKHSEYTAFGHIPNKINGMYKLWKNLLANQLSKFPSLVSNNANLLTQNDFMFIKNFAWTTDLWKPYIYNKTNDYDIGLNIQ